MKNTLMNENLQVRKMTYSAMFLALAFILPFFTGQIQQIGSMLCPMHIPVLLCGYICGGPWGMLVGLLTPILRSAVLGMPQMFPMAVCMSFELATYGFVAGWLYRVLPRNRLSVYVSLIAAMIAGRLVWGAVMFVCMGCDTGKFGVAVFLAASVTNAIPGIILQLILIPILVITLRKYTDLNG